MKLGRLLLNMLLFGVTILSNGCKKEGTSEAGPGPEVIIPSTTKPISSDDFNTKVVSISSDSSIFIFQQGVSTIDNLAPNDVMVTNIGRGLLRKVTSVTRSNNQVTVRTTQATIEEAIQKGSLEVTRVLTPGDTSSILYRARGVGFLGNAASPNGFYLSMDNVVIFDADGNPTTTYDQIVANGSIDISQTFAISLTIDNWKLKKLTMSVTFTENMQLTVEMNLLNLSYSKEKEILRTQFAPLTFFIGIVPVVITPILSISVGVDGRIYANITSSVSQSAEFTGGLKYENSAWSPMATQIHTFAFQPPTVAAGADLKGYIGPQLDFLLYGIVGPTANVSLYGNVVADVTQNPWLTLWAGITVEAGVTLNVLSHNIANYRTTVLDLRKKLWENTTLPNGAPSVPSNPNPFNNAVNQSTPLSLQWSACTDPENDPITYDVYFGTQSNPTMVATNRTSTSYNPGTLSNAMTYYWKVVAKDNHSNSTTGPIWRFTTASSGAAPSAPSLSSPSNGATGQSTSPTLAWNASASATSYTLQVSANSSFTSFVYNQSGLTNVSQQVTGLGNSNTYYWRASATNAYGTSGWSSVWQFTTASGGTAPLPPVLSSPPNNATGQPTSPTLLWSASTGATSYTLQVSTNSSFTSLVYNQTGLTSTSRQLTGLSNSTTYYWRVSATNSYGTSAWSSVWQLATSSGSVSSDSLIVRGRENCILLETSGAASRHLSANTYNVQVVGNSYYSGSSSFGKVVVRYADASNTNISDLISIGSTRTLQLQSYYIYAFFADGNTRIDNSGATTLRFGNDSLIVNARTNCIVLDSVFAVARKDLIAGTYNIQITGNATYAGTTSFGKVLVRYADADGFDYSDVIAFGTSRTLQLRTGRFYAYFVDWSNTSDNGGSILITFNRQ